GERLLTPPGVEITGGEVVHCLEGVHMGGTADIGPERHYLLKQLNRFRLSSGFKTGLCEIVHGDEGIRTPKSKHLAKLWQPVLPQFERLGQVSGVVIDIRKVVNGD